MAELTVYIVAFKEAWITCPEGYEIENNREITAFQIGSSSCEMIPDTLKYIETDDGRDSYTCEYRMELTEFIEGEDNPELIEQSDYDLMDAEVKEIVYNMSLDSEEFSDGVVIMCMDEQGEFDYEVA